MGKITWLEMLSASVFAAVAAMAGARVLMLKMERILREENRFNLAPTSSTLMSALVGAVAGLVIASIAIYYYLFATNSDGFVELDRALLLCPRRGSLSRTPDRPHSRLDNGSRQKSGMFRTPGRDLKGPRFRCRGGQP